MKRGEIFDATGIIAQVRAASIADMRLRVFQGRRPLADLDLVMQPTHDVPYPNIVYTPEWRTEGILRDHLATLGATVERSRELLAPRQSDGGVEATVRHTDTGAAEAIRTRSLVGSDGGKSTVRRLLNLSFEGETKPEHFRIGDNAIVVSGCVPLDVYSPDDSSGVSAPAARASISHFGCFNLTNLAG